MIKDIVGQIVNQMIIDMVGQIVNQMIIDYRHGWTDC